MLVIIIIWALNIEKLNTRTFVLCVNTYFEPVLSYLTG